MSKFYAYIHSKPNANNVNSIFYIGKGCDRRAFDFDSNRNKFYKNIVSKHGKSNIGVSIIECSSEKIALDLEVGLIKTLRRMGVHLCNMTDGGDGVSGYKHTASAIESMKNKLIGRTSPTKGKASKLKGKPLSDEHKRKLSEKKIGKESPRKGAVLSQSSRDAIKKAFLGRVWVNNGLKQHLCTKEDASVLLCNGFLYGRLSSKRTQFN